MVPLGRPLLERLEARLMTEILGMHICSAQFSSFETAGLPLLNAKLHLFNVLLVCASSGNDLS